MIKRLLLTNLFFVLLIGKLFAQSADTVYVPANNADGSPYFDSIIEKVVADTSASGQQLHSVYKLERGKFYILNKAITLRNVVQIVADPPVANDPDKTPPKIMSNITESGGTSTGSLIITYADITVKNVWLSGIDLGGINHGWGAQGALLVNTAGVKVVLDGIWCDYNSWSSFGSTQPHTRWFVNNFHARNEQNEGDQWTTFLFYLEGSTVIDTFVVTNSSYFQSNSCFLFPPKVVKYLKVDHCTFVDSYKWPFHQTQWLNATFTNNIFYNTGALSLTQTEAESQDPDDLMYGLVNVDTLAANQVGGDTLVSEYTIPENQRQIVVKNNLWYYSPEIQSYLASHDTVLTPVFMNERTKAMFANDATWPGLVEENTWNQDPMFNDFTGLSGAVAKLAQAVADIRSGSTHGWDWDGDQLTDPDTYKLLIQYPTAENFKSYSGLVGTDGKPLGDLSFYGSLSDVEKINGQIPSSFELQQNYPNPFNPTTKINFTIPQSGNFTLKVFNVLGQEVATLVNGQMQPGTFSATFDASKLSSGMYIYRLNGENISLSKKMMLVK
jgi:hypothetical protein